MIIQATGLTKKFGGHAAVDGLTFGVKAGEIVGLLGRNGAGKTTTVSLLLGLLTPTSGTIEIFGKNLQEHRTEILNRVNFSSAYINFPGRLSVRENLNVFAMLYDIPNRNKRIDEVLELFGIADLAREKYVFLSSGQQTRAHLAKAFLNKPTILFLDEPTAALDPDIADMVRSLILEMQEKYKLTVLLTSHNMAAVEESCDRVLFIDHGKLIAEDTPEELAHRISKTTVRLLIRDGLKRTLEYAKKHKFGAEIQGRSLAVAMSDEEIVYFLTFLAERGIKYQEISIDRPDLEDYFLSKTRGDHES